jgi:23S rRNA pseudouridine1911/1915/1917 synthase
MKVLYEDNHLIIVNKESGEIVQGDKTGDTPLSETVKAYLKEKYQKPGAVFLGVVHRLDRPVSGVVVFARTSKALTRLNKMFQQGEVHKTYWAIIQPPPRPLQLEGGLGAHESPPPVGGGWGEATHWLTRNEQQNKSYAYDRERPGAKQAILDYRLLVSLTNYHLLEVELKTGRHHQIRCQLAKIGCPIKGDLKYGAPRSNPDGSISLHARRVRFVHPVSHIDIDVTAPVPDNALWLAAEAAATANP